MNDKEALKVLKNLSIDYNGMDDDEIAEMDCAVDFAIAALEEKVASQLQDCKQVVDDLVSRQAAIDALVGITMFKTKHEIMQRVNASVQDEQGWLGAVAERKANEDRRMVKYLIIGTMLFITFALYACCIVGGEADDRSERWFYGRCK